MQDSKSYKIFKTFNVICMACITFITLYPFIYMFAQSFSSAQAVINNRVHFLPVDFNLSAYTSIITESRFWNGYRNTLLFTTTGTFLGLFLTVSLAYPLSRDDFPGKDVILKFMVFTMFFSGGLIPLYLLVSNLGWIDTIWAIIVPNAIIIFNVLVMRTFFMGIPQALIDAGEIDGLNQLQILSHIVIPLSKPIIATIGLFIAVQIWNDWFSALIFLNMDDLYPVTLFLRNIVMGSQMTAASGQAVDSSAVTTLPQTLQAATIMLVTIPILAVYPFIQKYFVQGMMIGSIKG